MTEENAEFTQTAPTLEEGLIASIWLSDNLREQAREGDFDLRERCALAMYQLCMDHRNAVVLLVERGARSSALALARSSIEAYVLGLWYEHAQEASLERLVDVLEGNRPPPKFETAAQAARAKLRPDVADAVEQIRLHYNKYSDYSHGHQYQLSRWVSDGHVGPMHDDADLVEMLRLLDAVGLMASIARKELLGEDLHPVFALVRQVEDGSYYAHAAQALAS
jgi:hypothetical protein